MKRIFITGGHGFVGYSLINTLKLQYDITVYDIIPPPEKYDAGAKYILGSITDIEHLTNSMRCHDYVIHLATCMDSSSNIDTFIKTVNIGIIGTLNVLKSMNENGIKNLMFFSSSFVYGNTHQNIEGNKEDDFKFPHTGYGISKLSSELFIQMNKKINYIILRPSIICGKYDWYGQSISIFIKKSITDKQITIKSDANEIMRDYVYIDDVCSVVSKLLETETFDNKIYNVSSHEPISTRQLVEKISTITGCGINVIPEKSDTPLKILNLDNSHISKIHTIRKLDTYLGDYINWARDNHESYWK
jgi:nucleoside-diphosphate-sugar epimerase